MKPYLIKSIISVCLAVAAVWGGYYLWNYKNRTLYKRVEVIYG